MTLKKPETEKVIRTSISFKPQLLAKLKEEADICAGGYVSAMVDRILKERYEGHAKAAIK